MERVKFVVGIAAEELYSKTDLQEIHLSHIGNKGGAQNKEELVYSLLSADSERFINRVKHDLGLTGTGGNQAVCGRLDALDPNFVVLIHIDAFGAPIPSGMSRMELMGKLLSSSGGDGRDWLVSLGTCTLKAMC